MQLGAVFAKRVVIKCRVESGTDPGLVLLFFIHTPSQFVLATRSSRPRRMPAAYCCPEQGDNSVARHAIQETWNKKYAYKICTNIVSKTARKLQRASGSNFGIYGASA